MKTFEDICRMTQNGLKEYMKAFLCSNKYSPVISDGYLYAKGSVPVLLVAHLDTVHRELCKEIINENGKISSPQGIGGDDRCGVFMIMNIVKELNCSVLLTEDEEKGGIGASKFAKSKYVKELGVNYMIEFDRKNSADAVYYSCDNKDFKAFVHDATGFKEAQGSYTDICTIMPAAMIAGVNLSCAYYNPHTEKEYVLYDDMMDNVEQAKALIKTKCEEPFKYVAKKYEPIKYYDRDYTQGSLFDYMYGSNFSRSKKKSTSYVEYDDDMLELEVIFSEKEEIHEVCDFVYGRNKAECWYKFFLTHPNICMDDVIDYSWA